MRIRFSFLHCVVAALTLGTLLAVVPGTACADDLRLHLRTRLQPFKGNDAWEEVTLEKSIPAKETAIIICDMWDNHWCKSATERCGVLAKKMAPIIDSARNQGVLIIHSPSDCMAYYKDVPQRKRILSIPAVKPPKPLDLPDPPLPIDDKDGGCDDAVPVKTFKAWTKQHDAITIGPDDVISDQGTEVYSYLQQRGIKNVILMGVHTNMCVLHRTFAIKQMTRWGLRCYLVRDLTDSMYDPRKAPFVKHEAGTELVIQHIEKHWCPSIPSTDLLK